jgi:uncharacterized membrane protein (DUF4010 family)
MTTRPSPGFSGYLASDSSSAWPSRSFTPGPGRTAQAACAAFPSSPSPAHCFTCSIRPDWSRSPEDCWCSAPALSVITGTAVGLTVTSVLLLTARERLHNLAKGLNTKEIVTAGKLLLLTGFVLPLLPDKPVTALTEITPRQVWLAMLAVCTISYASYLLQRYVAPPGAKPLIAVLGGFYSSTATTIVLARSARAASRTSADPAASVEAVTGIILATAIMYLRLLVVIFLFSRALATAVRRP